MTGNAAMWTNWHFDQCPVSTLTLNLIQKYQTLNEQMFMECFNHFVSILLLLNLDIWKTTDFKMSLISSFNKQKIKILNKKILFRVLIASFCLFASSLPKIMVNLFLYLMKTIPWPSPCNYYLFSKYRVRYGQITWVTREQ